MTCTADNIGVISDSTPLYDLARSWLLVPPIERRRIEDAASSRPDVLVLDLEDGVPFAHKDVARSSAVDWLTHHRAWARVNDASTADLALDLEALRNLSGLAGIVLAKTQHPSDVHAVTDVLPDVPVVAMVETAAALQSAGEIARADSVVRLALGVRDYCGDLGIEATPEGLSYARSALVVASRAAGLAAPVDGPTGSDDHARVRTDIDVTRRLGLTGKLCVKPDHVHPINERFTPSNETVAAAEVILERLGPTGEHIRSGADRPRFLAANALLARARYFARLDAGNTVSVSPMPRQVVEVVRPENREPRHPAQS